MPYNVPDKSPGDEWASGEHNMLKQCVNDTESRTDALEAGQLLQDSNINQQGQMITDLSNDQAAQDTAIATNSAAIGVNSTSIAQNMADLDVVEAALAASGVKLVFDTEPLTDLLTDVVVGQSVPFQSLAQTTFTVVAPSVINVTVDELASAGGDQTPVVVPAGVSGFVTKNADGSFHVSYTTSPNQAVLDVNRERWESTVQSTSTQPGNDGIFNFGSTGLVQTHNSRLVTYNNNNTWTVTTGIDPLEVRLNAATVGTTGTAERISYIKETGTANGTRLPNSTDGVFGEAVPNVVATAIIPPFTTITVEGRSVSSGNNQQLVPGASMEFVELVGYTEDKVDPVAIGTYLANSYKFHLAIAHEGDGGQQMTVTRNGAPVTYTDLLNATDVGGGQVNLAGGANGNFNRRASVVQQIQKPCDKFTITKPVTQPFDTQLVLITRQGGAAATTTNGEYRLSYSRGASAQTFRIQKIVNAALVDVYTDGNTAQAVEVERTLYGFRFTKANRVVYETPAPTECPEPGPENSLFQELETWDNVATGAVPMVAPTQVVHQNKLCTLISDTHAGGWHLLSNGSDNLPTSNEQIVLVEFARVDSSLGLPPTFGIRMRTNTLVRDVVINPDTGVVTRTDGDIQVVSVTPSGEFYQLVLRYTPNANYTLFQLYPAYGVNGATGPTAGEQGEILISKLDMNYSLPTVGTPDVISEFSGSASKTFTPHFDGRPVTVLEDSATTVSLSERNFSGAQFPYIEIEFQRDTAATHGLYLRPNTPGSGRQSLIRMPVAGDIPAEVNSSGANTANPTVLQTWTTEKTVRHLIQLNEPAGFEHTELEIAPAGTNATLVNTPAQTGSTGILSVTLYESNPLEPNGPPI